MNSSWVFFTSFSKVFFKNSSNNAYWNFSKDSHRKTSMKSSLKILHYFFLEIHQAIPSNNQKPRIPSKISTSVPRFFQRFLPSSFFHDLFWISYWEFFFQIRKFRKFLNIDKRFLKKVFFRFLFSRFFLTYFHRESFRCSSQSFFSCNFPKDSFNLPAARAPLWDVQFLQKNLDH